MNGDSDRGHTAGRAASADENTSPDLSLVLAVASSPVNGVVLSRIVQGAGLKAVHCTTPVAVETIRHHAACVVVVEEDTGEPEARAFRAAIEKRDSASSQLPYVVVLSRSAAAGEEHRTAGADAVVAMPITPDVLAPAILKLVERARRQGAS